MFQSTRPARGATSILLPLRGNDVVSIHAPRAGRDIILSALSIPIAVSIHAPRAGRDAKPFDLLTIIKVSIHAPRAGRDRAGSADSPSSSRFNPRAPRGARRTTASDSLG